MLADRAADSTIPTHRADLGDPLAWECRQPGRIAALVCFASRRPGGLGLAAGLGRRQSSAGPRRLLSSQPCHFFRGNPWRGPAGDAGLPNLIGAPGGIWRTPPGPGPFSIL